MGMSNYILDLEEQFFDAVEKVARECKTLDELFEKTDPQRDLVKHMREDEVDDVIGEIWFS